MVVASLQHIAACNIWRGTAKGKFLAIDSCGLRAEV